MVISATEFKNNFGHYIEMVGQEELIITKNGKRVAKLVKAEPSIVEQMTGLFGEKYADLDVKDWREMRIREKYMGGIND